MNELSLSLPDPSEGTRGVGILAPDSKSGHVSPNTKIPEEGNKVAKVVIETDEAGKMTVTASADVLVVSEPAAAEECAAETTEAVAEGTAEAPATAETIETLAAPVEVVVEATSTGEPAAEETTAEPAAEGATEEMSEAPLTEEATSGPAEAAPAATT
ncbi:hypothetical protein HYZ64_00935 [Candidatus Berkelbacteria bacterium]|nr:hypothetical protein [Candidatus Berkelbacteria bacterium]